MSKLVKCQSCDSMAALKPGHTEATCYRCRYLKEKLYKRETKISVKGPYINTTGLFDWKEYNNEIIM